MELAEYEPDALFDYIVSYSTFEHVHDLDGMIAETIRRLIPGGRLYFGIGRCATAHSETSYGRR